MNGNLGMYLLMTKAAKKLGGPLGLAAALVSGGILLGLAIDAIVKAVKESKENAGSEPVYTINQDAVSSDGVPFSTGSQFVVLVRDGSNALIETIGSEEHHILPVSFLAEISNYMTA